MNIFQQVWAWIAENVAPILSSTTFMAIVGFLIYFVKTRRTVGENTATNTKLSRELAEARKENAALKSEINDIKEQVLDTRDAVSLLTVKEDGVLAILQTVYSGLKPEVASTVNNIINNVKYAATKTRKDIAGNLDAVKAALDTASATVSDKIKDTKRIVGKEDGENDIRVSF